MDRNLVESKPPQKVILGNKSLIEFAVGDITQEETEAVVNAANSHLAGGGGVDGAIHRAGGPAIMKELKARYTGCPTGQAVITGGGDLKAKFVIHAVGPRYKGQPEDARLLRSAYETALALCSRKRIHTVSFPSISTGAYGYPLDQAARIAVKTVREYMEAHSEIKRTRFVLFDAATYEAYVSAARNGNV